MAETPREDDELGEVIGKITRVIETGDRIDTEAYYDRYPALKPEQLVGQNLGYTFAFLPTIETLLIDQDAAENGSYDRVVATNRLIDTLSLRTDDLIDVSKIA